MRLIDTQFEEVSDAIDEGLYRGQHIYGLVAYLLSFFCAHQRAYQ